MRTLFLSLIVVTTLCASFARTSASAHAAVPKVCYVVNHGPTISCAAQPLHAAAPCLAMIFDNIDYSGYSWCFTTTGWWNFAYLRFNVCAPFQCWLNMANRVSSFWVNTPYNAALTPSTSGNPCYEYGGRAVTWINAWCGSGYNDNTWALQIWL